VPQPTPVPTPLPARATLPDAPPPPAPAPAPPAASTRVYDEDEVDVKPRRIAGSTGSYPEWGPKLSKGRSVSITASYVVTEEGLVTDIRVERGGGVLEAILVELSRWKYLPGTKAGLPVKVRVRMKHTFIGG
jgi:protein TonB